VYIGSTDNSEFAGPAPLDLIAKQIYSSYGKRCSFHLSLSLSLSLFFFYSLSTRAYRLLSLNDWDLGPSGANKDYLLNLAHSLRTVAPTGNDQHLFELEARVKALMLQDAGSQEAFDLMLSQIIIQSKPPTVNPV